MNTKISEQQAIENLTRQTDYRGLCAHLIAAVSSITETQVRLFEAHDEEGRYDLTHLEQQKVVLRVFPENQNLPHPNWLTAAITKSTEGIEPDIVLLDDPEQLILNIGTLNGIFRFLHIDSEVDTTVRSSIIYLTVVFKNLLALLDRFERDALTGLLNRQSFDYRFEDLLEHHQRNPHRAQKTDATSWLAMIDIDRFKSINDTHGHLFGDEILLLTARLIQECFRFDDLAFRYGGEEFIVILNNTDTAGAELALERFREKIASYDFPTVGAVTVSIGWSLVRPSEAANSIIHRADRALYRAKELGRNQTVSFESAFGDDIEAGSNRETDAEIFR